MFNKRINFFVVFVYGTCVDEKKEIVILAGYSMLM